MTPVPIDDCGPDGPVRTDADSGGASAGITSTPPVGAGEQQMIRAWPELSLVVVTLVAAAIVVTAAGGSAGGVANALANGTDGVGGGTHVSVAAAAQEERFDGAARRAAFERDLSRAETPEDEAAAIARQLDDSEARLERLRRHNEALTAARENGSLSRAEYEVGRARLAAAARSVDRMADLLERAAEGLSDEQLREAGAPRVDIRELGSDAEAFRERTAGERASNGTVEVYADIETMTERYNAEVESRSSDRVQRQLHGEVVNMQVASGDATVTVSFRIDEDGRITGLTAGSRRDATLRMQTDAGTVRRLARADEPVGAFRRAVADDDVRLTGIGPVNWIEWAVVDLLA